MMLHHDVHTSRLVLGVHQVAASAEHTQIALRGGVRSGLTT